jgi:hypothetical protein
MKEGKGETKKRTIRIPSLPPLMPFIAGESGEKLKKVREELEKEIEFFNIEIEGKLKKYTGKYVAIKKHKVIAEGNSYAEVSEKVQRTPYAKERCILIRKVEKERPVHFVSIPLSTE